MSINEIVTIETVGEDNYRRNIHANSAVKTRMSKDVFINLLLGINDRLIEAELKRLLCSSANNIIITKDGDESNMRTQFRQSDELGKCYVVSEAKRREHK